MIKVLLNWEQKEILDTLRKTFWIGVCGVCARCKSRRQEDAARIIF